MMKLLSTVCISIGLMGAAAAAPVFVFQENFDNPAFIGSGIIVFGGGGGTAATSDRWANTNYYNINNGVNGWSFAGSVFGCGDQWSRRSREMARCFSTRIPA